MGLSIREIMEMEVGKEYCESCQYGNLYFELVSKPVQTGDEIRFKGKVLNDKEENGEHEVIDFLINVKHMNYAPNICYKDMPDYVSLKDIQN